MFWIQETGVNKNNYEYRLYYAEEETDIDLLPTNLIEGKQSIGDKSVNKKCALGSECYCIETGDAYVLTSSGWQLM